MERKPVAYCEAVVRFPIFEGDRIEHLDRADWYEYVEPGVNARGNLDACRRECKLVGTAKIIPAN